MRANRNSMRAAKALRRQMSPPEVLLWQFLRGAPSGVKFRRQNAIGPYVADFYCPAAKLVIEIDGQVHGLPERIARDEERDALMRSYGLNIQRIAAADVLENPAAVASAIVELCSAGPLHHSAAPNGPPSHGCAAGRIL